MMATVPTPTEAELIDALELFLDVAEVQDAEPSGTAITEPDLFSARIVATIALAHAFREPHCCGGNCDLDTCEEER